MEVESDGACAEGCELDEFIYDDDELMESAVASPQSKGLIPRYHSPESLDRRIDELIRETAALMGLNEAFVGILLRKFDWRSDALIQEWFNDSAAVLRKGRLPPVVREQDREDAPGTAECESAPAEPEASDSALKTPCTSVDVSKKEEAVLG